MLADFRKLLRSWIAPVMMGLMVVSMAFYALVQNRDLFTASVGDNVITSKARNVSSAEYRTIYERAAQQAQQQAGQQVTPQLAVQAGFDRQVLNGAAQDTALSGFVHSLGIRPSEKLFNAQLQQYTAFFDKVTGKFDEATYQQTLAQNGVTPAKFKADTLDNMALNDLGDSVRMGVRAPLVYASMVSALLQEKRDFSYFEVGAKSVPAPAAPTDAELTDFIKANGVTRNEFRTFDVVRFSAADLSKGPLPIDQTKLQQRYDFEKDAVNKPETRSFVQIPVKDAAQGADVAARLAKGEDPAAIAKSVGKEVVTNTDKPKTAIGDKALADAVFSTDAGKATAPVTTALGMQVAKVTGVTPGRTITLEQMRPQLEKELKDDAAKQKAYDQTEAYTKAKSGGAAMEAAAAAAGAKVEHFGPLNASGMDADNKSATVDSAIVKRAFNLKQGEEESDVVDSGGGEYSVIRVTKVEPKHTPSVDEVRGDLTKAYLQNKEVEAVQAKAKDLVARWSKGEDGAKLAAEAGGKLITVTGLNQEGAQARTDLQPLIGPIFNTKLGEVTSAPMTGSIAVIKVQNLSMPDTATMASYAMDRRTVLEQQIFSDLTASLQAGVRQEMRVKTNLDKARLAMGLDTDTVKKLKADAKAPAKTPAK